MKLIQRISEAECEVMNVIWTKGPVSTYDIIENLATEKNWQPRTIRTLIDRLVKKEALEIVSPEQRPHFYRSKISKEEFVNQESQSFLSRVFGGSSTPMLLHLAKTSKLSSSDLEELKKILKEKKA
jgi:BlaI family transcriptional regulator, penicillinase repressor